MHCNLGGGSTWAIVAVTWAIVAVTWEIVADSCDYCPKKAICLGLMFTQKPFAVSEIALSLFFFQHFIKSFTCLLFHVN